MNKIIKFALLVTGIGVLAGCQPPDGVGSGPASTFRVKRVLDGDSVILRGNDGDVEVRLAGIDAPERGQPYGDQARARLRELLKDRGLRLEIRDRDRYGRTVAVIRLDDGLEVNAELVREGAAWVHRTYGDATWFLYEAAARKDRRGLWGRSNPVAPWEWRNNPRLRE